MKNMDGSVGQSPSLAETEIAIAKFLYFHAP